MAHRVIIDQKDCHNTGLLLPSNMQSKNTQHLLRILGTIVVIILATDLAPPFLRILGSRTWVYLNITEAQWSILMAVRGLIFIVFILAAGVMADLSGRRRMLLISLACFIACIPLLMLFEPRSMPFYITYGIWSIIGIIIRTLTVTFLILEFEGTQRILALVIYSIVSGIGFLLSPLITTAINQSAGFLAIFILPLIIAIAGYVLALKLLPESRASSDFWGMDSIGLAIWTFGLCLVIFSILVAWGLGWTNPLVLAGLTIGMFIILAMRWLSDQRIFGRWNFRLRYDGQLGIAIFAGIVLNLALFAIATQMFNFLSMVQNYSAVIAGIAIAPIAIGAFMSLQAVRLTSRWSVKQAMAVGLVLMAASAAIFSLLQPDITYWVLLPCLLLLGFGYILANSPRLLLVSASMPRNLAATVQSIASASSHLGSALAYSLMMTLIEGFGMNAYVQTLEALGLTEFQISIRLTRLSRATEEFSILLPPEEQAALLKQIDYWIIQAYTTGLSRALLVLALVCLISAGIVYAGLRKSKKANELEIL